jgi:hypothetical protein
LKAWSRGDGLGQFAAEYLAERIDESTPDGPRLSDELDAIRQSTAA